MQFYQIRLFNRTNIRNYDKIDIKSVFLKKPQKMKLSKSFNYRVEDTYSS